MRGTTTQEQARPTPESEAPVPTFKVRPRHSFLSGRAFDPYSMQYFSLLELYALPKAEALDFILRDLMVADGWAPSAAEMAEAARSALVQTEAARAVANWTIEKWIAVPAHAKLYAAINAALEGVSL